MEKVETEEISMTSIFKLMGSYNSVLLVALNIATNLPFQYI